MKVVEHPKEWRYESLLDNWSGTLSCVFFLVNFDFGVYTDMKKVEAETIN